MKHRDAAPFSRFAVATLDDMGRRRWQRASVEKRDRDRGKPLKRPYWQLRYYVDEYDGSTVVRRRRTEFLGYCPAGATADRDAGEITKREAQRKADAKIATVNGLTGPLSGPMTVADFVERHWRPSHLEIAVAASTRRKYLSHLDNYILPALGSLRLDLATSEHTSRLLSSMEQAGRSWMTRQDTRTVLSSIFTKALQWRKMQGPHPMDGVELGIRKTVREKRIFTAAEVAMLLAVLPEPSRTLAELLDATGCRISEALALQGKHIDYPHEGYVMISQAWVRGDLREATKSDNGLRAVPMGAAAESLRALAGGPDDFLFMRDDGQPHNDSDLLQHQLRPALKTCKLYTEGCGWHTFRRTVVSELQAAGATMAEVQKLAGHAGDGMTRTYTVVSDERASDLAKRRRVN